MNEEQMAMDIYVLLAKEYGYPEQMARREAGLWIAGVRNSSLSDFCVVHMDRCRDFAVKFKQDTGL